MSVTANTPQPPESSAGRFGQNLTMILAVFWLVATIGVGLGLVTADAPKVDGPSFDDYQAYGGDAYTGIQNASVDTQATVANAANSQLEQMADIEHGIGYLVIGMGVTTFILSVQRLTGERARQ